MRLKKRVFIGSSLEAKDLAFALQTRLQDKYECVIWYEGFFSLGNHFYTDLVRKITTFDYAIMIGAEDDRVTRISSSAEKISPRDNIYLEYGLFSGILSPKRVLLLIHKNCVPASDLSGMSLASYSNDSHALDLASAWLNELEDPNYSRSIGRKDVGILPTVGIAVGYFYNFIKPLIEKCQNEKGLPYAQVKLTVCIPDFIENDVNFYSNDLMIRQGLQKDTVCGYRVLVDPTVTEGLSLYDVPFTIIALFKTVDYIFENQENDTSDTRYAKTRALDNFYEVIATLIESNPYTKRCVRLVRYSDVSTQF